jgi:hypothetical protein
MENLKTWLLVAPLKSIAMPALGGDGNADTAK